MPHDISKVTSSPIWERVERVSLLHCGVGFCLAVKGEQAGLGLLGHKGLVGRGLPGTDLLPPLFKKLPETGVGREPTTQTLKAN